VRILEVDAERRRLSLSLKRVEDGMPLQPGVGEDAAPPSIDLSEDVFADGPAAADREEAPALEPEAAAPEAAEEEEPDAVDEPESGEEPVVAESADEPAEGSDDTAPPAA
jgi:small subunit ribosomal protein S1